MDTAPRSSNTPVRDERLVRAGRAFEAGDVDEAASLLDSMESSSAEFLYLSARVAEARGDHQRALTLFDQVIEALPPEPARDVERRRPDLISKMKQPARAAAELERYIEHYKEALTPDEQARLRGRIAGWLLDADRTEESLGAYENALGLASTTPSEQTLRLGLAEAALHAGDTERASTILAPLAFEGQTARILRGALELIERYDLDVRLTPAQQIDRARALISHRAFGDADAALRSLPEELPAELTHEVEWLRARIAFKRRNRYEDAHALFDKIAGSSGPRATEAEFWAARSLSRLDRDKEAIAAYRTFAKNTKDKQRGLEALFLAAKLEFYLGRDEAAMVACRELVGRGGKKSASRLSPDNTRDCHFMAGIGAMRSGRLRRALVHLEEASIGTDHPEVLARNSYWAAVARWNSSEKEGATALRGVCENEPTGWYALHARSRLEEAGLPLGPCRLPTLKSEVAPVPSKRLFELSPAAEFLAGVGLYREAAKILEQAEKQGTIDALPADWISYYNALDAPHYAVARAAEDLGWPPAAGDIWRAKAAYPRPFSTIVRRVERSHELPTDLIYAIARKESMFDPKAVSWVGAMGLMQMMPRTYEANRKRAGLPPLEPDKLPTPEHSLKAAGFELAYLMRRFGGSLPLAIMGYNAGPGAVDRWLERSGGLPLDLFVEKAGFTQTRNYVKRVIQNLVRYRQLEGLEPPTLPKVASVSEDKN